MNEAMLLWDSGWCKNFLNQMIQVNRKMLTVLLITSFVSMLMQPAKEQVQVAAGEYGADAIGTDGIGTDGIGTNGIETAGCARPECAYENAADKAAGAGITECNNQKSLNRFWEPAAVIAEIPAFGTVNPEITEFSTESKEVMETVDLMAPDGFGEEAVPISSRGFLIDKEGFIYDFCPDCTAVDGGMCLPGEGCVGIRRGALLAAAGLGIVELYIPANITAIEDGAFWGLDELEWIENEAGNGYLSVEGVLFDGTGSTLILFPGGRTGVYGMPAGVTAINMSAFVNTSLNMIDMRLCPALNLLMSPVTDKNGVPVSILYLDLVYPDLQPDGLN